MKAENAFINGCNLLYVHDCAPGKSDNLENVHKR